MITRNVKGPQVCWTLFLCFASVVSSFSGCLVISGNACEMKMESNFQLRAIWWTVNHNCFTSFRLLSSLECNIWQKMGEKERERALRSLISSPASGKASINIPPGARFSLTNVINKIKQQLRLYVLCGWPHPFLPRPFYYSSFPRRLCLCARL